jgi:nitroreductase
MLHLDLVVAGWKAGIDTVSRNAPHLILTNGQKTNPAAKTACIIAMTYLELAIPPLGLGGCWNGFFNAAALSWPPLKEALGLAKDMENFGAMMVGYPKFRYHRMPTRNTPEISWL